MSASIRAIFTSFISFIQSLGVNIKLPSVNCPPFLKKILDFFGDQIDFLSEIIPSLPTIDFRFQLLVFSIVVPFLADIFLISFINPIVTLVLNLIDMVAFCLLGFSVSQFLFSLYSYFIIDSDSKSDSDSDRKYDPKVLKYYFIIGGVGWILVRLVIYKFTRIPKPNLVKLMPRLTASRLDGHVPNIECEATPDEVKEEVKKCGHAMLLTEEEIKKDNRSLLKILLIFVAFCAAVGGSLLYHYFLNLEIIPGLQHEQNTNNSNNSRLSFDPTQISLINPLNSTDDAINKFSLRIDADYLNNFVFFLLLFLSLILLLALTVPSCVCGRKLSHIISKFVTRYSLKILFVVFDVLYIPVLTIFLRCVIPKTYDVPKGSYINIFNPYPDYFLAGFVMNYNETKVCNITNLPNGTDPERKLKDYCEKKACKGGDNLRLMEDMSLRYIDDVLYTCLGLLFFSFFCVVLGIPVLWSHMIFKNIDLISSVHVYGKSVDDKWLTLSTKLSTPGISLFSVYKFSTPYWCVLELLMKFLLVVITLVLFSLDIDEKYFKVLIFILPIYYIVQILLLIRYRPYSSNWNTVIDIILKAVNLFFSIVPILSQEGVVLPDQLLPILSLVAVVVPIVAIVVLFICSPKLADAAEDWTTVEKLEKDVVKSRVQRVIKKLFNEKYKNDPMIVWIKDELGIKSKDANKELTKDQKKILKGLIDKFPFKEDLIEACYLDISTIKELKEYQIDKLRKAKKRRHAVVPLQNIDQVTPVGDIDQVIAPEDAQEDVTKAHSNKNRGNSLINFDGDPEKEKYQMNRRVIGFNLNEAYLDVDVALDGFSVGLLRKIIQMSVNMGTFAIGWFFGSLIGFDPFRNAKCF